MILKGLRYIIYFILYVFFIICVCWLIFHIENLAYLVTGAYPALGKYYISFTKDKEEILPTVYYKQLIYDEKINLSNLILYVNDGAEYCIENKKDIFDDDKIRILLLENGLAELEDVDIATVDEVKAQDDAIKNQNGAWKVSDSNSITLHDIFNVIFQFFDSYLGKVLTWAICAIGIGSIILLIIKKIITFRKIDTIFMGGTSSGKTTIVRRFEDPNITEGKLLAESTSTKSRKVSKGSRIPSGNKDIYPRLYDNPGNELGKMMDELKKFTFNKSEKRVVVYVISFTKENKYFQTDYEYINKEIIRAVTLIQILKTSKAIKRANKIIVFFNKCDLLYKTEQDYLEDKNHIKIRDIYGEREDLQILKKYADSILYGSAIKGWGISELVENIKSLC